MSEFKLQNGPQQDDLPAQASAEQPDLFAHLKPENKLVTCLGQTFPNDAARREHFTKLLAEKRLTLRIPVAAASAAALTWMGSV